MQQSLNTLSLILDESSSLIREISGEDFNHKPSPNKWSKKELLGHLVDSAFNNLQRFIRAQYEDIPFIRYDQDAWVNFNNYQQYDRETVLNLWLSMNRHIMHVISSADKNKLQRLCKTSMDGEPKSIEWLFVDYVKHLHYHLGQILPGYGKKVEVYP